MRPPWRRSARRSTRRACTGRRRLRDEKILAAWNGLDDLGVRRGRPRARRARYVEAAARAATHSCCEQACAPDGRLARSSKDGRAGAAGFLDDYAFRDARACSISTRRRSTALAARAAIALAERGRAAFADPAGGWFMTADDQETLIAREKPAYDGAEPSGTSVALLNALRLATFTADDRWRAIAERAFAAIAPTLTENPLALTEALLALD